MINSTSEDDQSSSEEETSEEENYQKYNGQCCTLDQLNYYKSIVEMNGLYVLTTDEKKSLLDYVMNNEMDTTIKNKIIEFIVTTKEKEKLPRIDNVYRLSEVLERYRDKEKKPITIQELHQEINTLKIEIKTLRKENETLDFRLS